MGGLAQGMDAALFLVMWVAMKVVIMFPTAAPMILTFAAVQANKRARGNACVPTWLFVASYLLLWTVLGVAAFAAAQSLDALAAQWMWLQENGGRFGGLVLMAAGVYQFTALKRVCLNKCRTPLTFIMTSWRLALITAVIFAEKALPIGPRVAQGAAVVLVAYGALAVIMPGILPMLGPAAAGLGGR